MRQLCTYVKDLQVKKEEQGSVSSFVKRKNGGGNKDL